MRANRIILKSGCLSCLNCGSERFQSFPDFPSLSPDQTAVFRWQIRSGQHNTRGPRTRIFDPGQRVKKRGVANKFREAIAHWFRVVVPASTLSDETDIDRA